MPDPLHVVPPTVATPSAPVPPEALPPSAGTVPGGCRVPHPGSRGLAELGMATAEYAVATLAAAGFAGLLLVLLRSGEVRALLYGIIRRALAVG